MTDDPEAPRGDVLDRLRKALEGRPEILDAYLFGSAARGEARAHSDLDVAVWLTEDAQGSPERTGFGYDAELSATLMSACAAPRVDVVLLHRAPPLLYHRVLRDGIRLMSRDLKATTTREGRALSRHCDFALQRAKFDVVASERVRSGDFGR